MADLNVSVITGRVMSQPKIKSNEDGKLMAQFTIASHRFVRDESSKTGWTEKTDRIPVVCWGYVAEKAAKLGTGAYVSTRGRLQSYDYGQEPGEALVTKLEVALDDLYLIIKGREVEINLAQDQLEQEDEYATA